MTITRYRDRRAELFVVGVVVLGGGGGLIVAFRLFSCTVQSIIVKSTATNQEHGSTRVPQRLDSEKYPKLGKWVKTQRDAYVNESMRNVRFI